MSYWANLCDPVTGSTLDLDELHEMKGGSYVQGGTRSAELNVTYNYCGLLREALGHDEDLRSLDGKTGAETIPLLKAGAETLGDETDPDYWKPAPGNVKRALLQLLALAQLRPDGVWRIS